MRIVQLANFYGPNSGGLRVCVDELARHYVTRGHEVMLVVPGEADRREVTTVVGAGSGHLTVVHLESPRIPGLGGYRAIVDIGEVRGLIREFQPDVIELSDKLTLPRAIAPRSKRSRPASNRSRSPAVVLISHERLDAVVGAQLPRRIPVGRATARLSRSVLERVDAVVCASQFAAEEFTRATTSVPVVRIPLGVDLETFHPDRRHGAPPCHDDVPEVLYVGRLSPDKRPDLAIDAVRRLLSRHRFVRLRMVGAGPMAPALQRAAAGLPVEFVGPVSDRVRLATMIASADAVISTGPHETFGLAALEALACGTPIVANPAGALRELLVIGAGVVAGRTAEGFADALSLVLLADREVQRCVARERAEQYGWDRAGAAFLDLYRGLTEGPSPIGPSTALVASGPRSGAGT